MAGNLASVLALSLVFTLFHTLVTVSGQYIPQVALFTFGDSNLDAGNRKYITNATIAQLFWPYGKSRDDPNGKFGDGRIVPDFIATFIGIPHDIPPALKPGTDLSRGGSFAVGFASILGSPKDSLSLKAQVGKFNEKISTWTPDYIQKSAFYIHIGMEDYINFIKNTPDGDVDKFVTSVTTELEDNIKLLYSYGARKFIIQMLPPLGCLPMMRQEYGTKDECYEKLNEVAKKHNAKLGPMLNALAKAKSGFQFTVFDFYNVILRRLHRTNYRFAETKKACCGVGTHNAYGCGFPNVHSKLCEYQRSYLYFDGYHNTEKAQESFAHLLFGADPIVVQPMTVRELVVYPVGEPMREYWTDLTTSKLSLVFDFFRSMFSTYPV